jgi:hypothetical protein
MAGVKQKRGATPKQRHATQVKLIHEDMLYNVNGKIERINEYGSCRAPVKNQ